MCTKLLQGFYCETAAGVCIKIGLSLQTIELQRRQQLISSAEGNSLYEMSGLKHKKAVMHKWESEKITCVQLNILLVGSPISGICHVSKPTVHLNLS